MISDEQFLEILTELDRTFQNRSDIVSIFHVGELSDAILTFEIRVAHEASRQAIPSKLSLNVTGLGEIAISLLSKVGPMIRPAIAPRDTPWLQPLTAGVRLGGEFIQNQAHDGWGTMTLTLRMARFRWKNRYTPDEYIIEESPAIVSNNHVIARNDAGVPGEVLVDNDQDAFGELRRFIPVLPNGIWVDVALGSPFDLNRTQLGHIAELGLITGARLARVGDAIRKRGARTGLTSGRVEARGNIRVGNKTFIDVYRTTPNFGCPGDSGSPVVDNAMQWIGVFSWGDVNPAGDNAPDCGFGGHGYFWTMSPRSKTPHGEDGIEIEIE